MNIEHERAAFEAAMKRRNPSLPLKWIDQIKEYASNGTQHRWIGWQASAAARQSGEPFGYFRELLDHEGKGNGVFLGCCDKKVSEQGYIEGETSTEIIALYTHPAKVESQQRTVKVPELTDDHIHDIMSKHVNCSYDEGLQFARAVIAEVLRMNGGEK